MRRILLRPHRITNTLYHPHSHQFNLTRRFSSSPHTHRIHRPLLPSHPICTNSHQRDHCTFPLTSVRSFSSRQSGSFSHPATQKKKSAQTKSSTSDDANSTASIHSKATTRTIQSSTRTRTENGKTETVHRQTISNNTAVHHGQNNVKMTFSQNSETRSETDERDPSQNTASKSTQTYKRMDIESPDGKDSSTVINSSQESLSAADADASSQSDYQNTSTPRTVSASFSSEPRV